MVEDTQNSEYHPNLEEENFISDSDSDDKIVAHRDSTPSTEVFVAKNSVLRSTTDTFLF